jgi:hypothetical protein
MTISRRFFLRKLISLTKGLAVLGIPHTLHAKSIQPRVVEPLLGSISIFAFNFAPKNWAQCNGHHSSLTKIKHSIHSLAPSLAVIGPQRLIYPILSV